MEREAKRRRVAKTPAARREDLLDAGLAVFREKGMRTATVEDVTTRAGVAKGTIYLYFKTKEELGVALRERFALELLQRSEDVLAGLEAYDWEARAEALVRSVVTFSLERRELAELAFHGLPPAGDGDVVAASERKVLALFRDTAARGAAAGRFDVSDPETTAALLFHGLHGALMDLAHGPGEADAERLVEAAAELLRRGLGARGSAGSSDS
jgi:AcrR family transcriptional regulator